MRLCSDFNFKVFADPKSQNGLAFAGSLGKILEATPKAASGLVDRSHWLFHGEKKKERKDDQPIHCKIPRAKEGDRLHGLGNLDGDRLDL